MKIEIHLLVHELYQSHKIYVSFYCIGVLNVEDEFTCPIIYSLSLTQIYIKIGKRKFYENHMLLNLSSVDPTSISEYPVDVTQNIFDTPIIFSILWHLHHLIM